MPRAPEIADGKLQTADSPAAACRRLQIAAIGLIAVFASCTAPPEQSILDQFFAAARLRDNTALGKLATVTFEPLERGIVDDFEITSVTTERPDRKHVTIAARV